MRHVRMLGLCLVAMLAMSATALVVASPALAGGCNEECKAQKKKEKTEAKEKKQEEKALETGIGDPWGKSNYRAFKACPWEEYKEWSNIEPNMGITDCVLGITLGGKQGGFFEYGKIRVPLSKAVKLQGGFRGSGATIQVVAPREGYEPLEAPPLPVEGGLKVISPVIQEEANWPEALKESYKTALMNGEKGIDVKIEMAGEECLTVPGCLDTTHILEEKGVAFRLPLKVKVTAPWLETLGAQPCYIGSDENPIHINLTTEGDGSAGDGVKFNEEFTISYLANSKLVDTGWHIPKVSGASCGGEYASYLDKALNIALQVEGADGYEFTEKTGIVVLKGDLHDGIAEAVAEAAERGEVE